MNVLRSLARNLWNVMDVKSAGSTSASLVQPEAGAKTLNAVRQQRVPGVLGLGRFRDGFEQLPQPTARGFAPERAFRPQQLTRPAFSTRDGFESATRRPVDLSGAMKSTRAEAKSTTPVFPNLGATLDDLAALI
ncbi:MAG: hypothetical protein U0228_04515 [Myxococcaceae bacterium]